jgi:hypothetical protein
MEDPSLYVKIGSKEDVALEATNEVVTEVEIVEDMSTKERELD